MASTDEGRLVEAAKAGDQRAFGQLFDQWFDRVHDLSRRIVHDDGIAGEVAQDAFLQAWTKLDSLDDVDAFGGWLLRIARNRSLNRLEKERRSVSVDDETMTAAADARAPEHDPLARMDQAARVDLVWDAAAALGPRDASVLDLHLRHGLTPAELAEELGCTPNNAHQVLFTMRKRLGTSVKALVLWRAGRPTCTDLRQGLAAAGLTSFGAPMVKAIDRHATSCDACSGERDDRLSPAALFAAAPIVVAASLIKANAAAGLAAEGVPMVGSSAAAGTAASAGANATGGSGGASGSGTGVGGSGSGAGGSAGSAGGGGGSAATGGAGGSAGSGVGGGAGSSGATAASGTAGASLAAAGVFSPVASADAAASPPGGPAVLSPAAGGEDDEPNEPRIARRVLVAAVLALLLVVGVVLVTLPPKDDEVELTTETSAPKLGAATTTSTTTTGSTTTTIVATVPPTPPTDPAGPTVTTGPVIEAPAPSDPTPPPAPGGPVAPRPPPPRQKSPPVVTTTSTTAPTAAPTIISFTAVPNPTMGCTDSTKTAWSVSWETTGAASVVIEPSGTTGIPNKDTKHDACALAGTTRFTLTATGPGGGTVTATAPQP